MLKPWILQRILFVSVYLAPIFKTEGFQLLEWKRMYMYLKNGFAKCDIQEKNDYNAFFSLYCFWSLLVHCDRCKVCGRD